MRNERSRCSGVGSSMVLIASRQNVFCFVSDHTRRRALDAEPWSYPFSTVVYSGIDHGSFPVVDAKAEQRWRGRLLYVGRLDAWKGVDTLLRALTLLPADTTLTCYGRGGAEQRARLGRLAETLGISERVSFGSLERHELAARYQRLLESVQTLQSADPDVQALKVEAAAAVEAGPGSYNRAEDLLARAEEIDRRAMA